MRNLIIAECINLLNLMNAQCSFKWDSLSNRDLLNYYKELLIDYETEEY